MVEVYSTYGEVELNWIDDDVLTIFKGHSFNIHCGFDGRFNASSARLTSRNIYIEKPSDPETHQFASFTFPAADDSHNDTYECDYNNEHRPEVFSSPRKLHIIVKEVRDVRLVNGSRCAGRLEVKHRSVWRPVSNKKNSWTLKEAAVVCRQLKCGTAVSTGYIDSMEVQPVWRFLSDCDGSEFALKACGAVKEWPSSSTVHVSCSDVLIPPTLSFYSFMKGFIDDQQEGVRMFRGHSFNINCTMPPLFPGGHFSLLINQIKKDTQPAVNHSALFHIPAVEQNHQGPISCVYHYLNQSSESRSLYLTVEDNTDVSLKSKDGTEAYCSGIVHLGFKDGWGMLSFQSTVWDLKHASLVCKQIGCGSAVATKADKIEHQGSMLRFLSDCDGSESALMDCGTVSQVYSSTAIHVTCTGHED
ncbi:scavenger receptor cysteine-rich type 1 protein M130-like [Genypterus blacodes]|uniref:scavenger receptor cysteine-rich type 1 protein M130-like n=1 Tax=Genypterus blacodes TaxID=154954 RepID=UPI003F76C631